MFLRKFKEILGVLERLGVLEDLDVLYICKIDNY
jgi:hypothetical protein